MTTPTILENIVATKREEILAAQKSMPGSALRRQIPYVPAPRDFFAALSADSPAPGPVRLIAEVKKASPSKGVIREDFEPVEIAKTYEAHGAACISVLTDTKYFQGSISYLTAIHAAVSLPLLRKDFIVDPYQVMQARAAGADAVLLIAECLPGSLLSELHAMIVELGMTPLVELHDPEYLPAVLDSGAKLIGINNRNLHTFEVDIEQTVRLRAEIPADRLVVGESGIRTRDDVIRLADAGVAAMLVGETLMAQTDIGAAVDSLLR